MKKNGKKPALSPEAAKILEQYRNAGKTESSSSGVGPDGDSEGAGPKPSSAAQAPRVHRSGTRGK